MRVRNWWSNHTLAAILRLSAGKQSPHLEVLGLPEKGGIQQGICPQLPHGHLLVLCYSQRNTFQLIFRSKMCHTKLELHWDISGQSLMWNIKEFQPQLVPFRIICVYVLATPALLKLCMNQHKAEKWIRSCREAPTLCMHFAHVMSVYLMTVVMKHISFQNYFWGGREVLEPHTCRGWLENWDGSHLAEIGGYLLGYLGQGKRFSGSLHKNTGPVSFLLFEQLLT